VKLIKCELLDHRYEEESTKISMEKFFQNWGRGLEGSAAIRTAVAQRAFGTSGLFTLLSFSERSPQHEKGRFMRFEVERRTRCSGRESADADGERSQCRHAIGLCEGFL
jgi:hypothetical protein